jgi:hypothetical protein
MKVLWCWRCKQEMPMLDEDEWALVETEWKNGFNTYKGSIDERFRPMRDLFKEITAFHETNQLAIMHHRVSLYGDLCGQCGKPLRTPQAAFCAACGWQPSR